MQEYMRFQVLFNEYFKDLYSFYKIIPNIDTNESGTVSFGKALISYENFLDKNIIKPTIKNCLLELNTSEEFHIIEEKILKAKAKIIEKSFYSVPQYILTEDPSGLKVKINFNNKKDIFNLKIPYSGTIESIDKFYNALGIHCQKGNIELNNFVIDYYSPKEKIQIMADDFELVLYPDEDASVLKNIINKNGGIILKHENTVMGELIVAQDPANLELLLFPESSYSFF